MSHSTPDHRSARKLATQIAEEQYDRLFGYGGEDSALTSDEFDKIVKHYTDPQCSNDRIVKMEKALQKGLTEDQAGALSKLSNAYCGDAEAHAIAGFVVGLELGRRLAGGAR